MLHTTVHEKDRPQAQCAAVALSCGVPGGDPRCYNSMPGVLSASSRGTNNNNLHMFMQVNVKRRKTKKPRQACLSVVLDHKVGTKKVVLM